MKPSVLVKLAALLIVALSLLMSPKSGKAIRIEAPAVQTETSLNFCVTDMPLTGNYPEVAINFRIYDQLLNPVDKVSEQDLRISENDMPAVPFSSIVQDSSQALGMEFYFLVDRGNRTDQSQAKYLLDSFVANNYNEALDDVQVYTDDGNQATLYYPNPAVGNLSQAITGFPTDRIGSPRVADNTIRTIMNTIEAGSNTCQKPRILFLVIGDNVISANLTDDISRRAKESLTKIIIYHTANPFDRAFNSRTEYEQLAANAGGQYIQVDSTSDITRLVSSTISGYRQSFTGIYRTNNGENGSHNISFVYKGVTFPSKGYSSYGINLMPPLAFLAVPSIIERTATQSVSTGYLYDKTVQTVLVNVSFPDGFPRGISSGGVLVINSPANGQTRVPILLSPSSGDTYQFTWDLADLGDSVRNDLAIRVELTDETGLVFISQDTPVAILSQIPLSLMGERYLVYVMLGIVLLLAVALITMWRRMGNLMVHGRDAISNVVGVIRKTIVGGGGRRGKALASIKILDGPASMINQELKIFTESVKLGRDPQKADMTFHAPDAKSSVSGLHARIEKVNGAWRIVAVSQSGSETFINEVAIPFNEPRLLTNGQVIRLGYLAQQPVVFTFQTDVSNETLDDVPRTTMDGEDLRKTIVKEDVPTNVVRISAEKKEILKKAKAESDSIFDEFRDR
jgi:hypothetical protein